MGRVVNVDSISNTKDDSENAGLNVPDNEVLKSIELMEVPYLSVINNSSILSFF